MEWNRDRNKRNGWGYRDKDRLFFYIIWREIDIVYSKSKVNIFFVFVYIYIWMNENFRIFVVEKESIRGEDIEDIILKDVF